jgi:hypothetical protein
MKNYKVKIVLLMVAAWLLVEAALMLSLCAGFDLFWPIEGAPACGMP